MQTMTLGEPVTQPWAAGAPSDDLRTTELVDLMLKDRRRLDALIRDEARAPDLIPRLLAVALLGFTDLRDRGHVDREPGQCAAPLGAVGAMVRWHLGEPDLGLCRGPGRGHRRLPAELLLLRAARGVKLSMLQATAHAVKCLAVTAVVLVGALPIYVAVSMGMIVFSAPAEWMQWTIGVGLALPFLAGLWGVRSLFVGFTDLADTLPACRQAPPRMLPATADPGLVRLLHDGHSGDDLLALDPLRRLIRGSRRPAYR